MSIEVILEGQLEKEKDKDAFSEYIKSVCEQKKIHIEDYDTTLMMDICPEGFIECSYEGTFVSITAQTNVAGAGFHAFVCEFYDELQTQSPISLEVSDPTKYYEERNFENLKYQYFYRWLSDIAVYIKENHDQVSNLCISWPMDTYQPLGKQGYVVTPMGYISIEDLKTKDIEELAQQFFIWNERAFNAQYYRNCALSLLWKECFFEYSDMNEYSDKMANAILDYLEAAYELDHDIKLPLDAYHVLCEAIHRTEVLQDAQQQDIAGLGYRRELVSYPFGNWRIIVHGCSEQGYDEKAQTLHFMAPYTQEEEGWKWLIKANAFVANENPQFVEGLNEEGQDIIEHFSFDQNAYQAKGIIQKTDGYYTVLCEYICKNEILFLEAVACDSLHLEKVKEWMSLVEYHPSDKEEDTKGIMN